MKLQLKFLMSTILIFSIILTLFSIYLLDMRIVENKYIKFVSNDSNKIKIVKKGILKKYNLTIPIKYILERRNYDIFIDLTNSLYNTDYFKVVIKLKNRKILKLKENNVILDKNALTFFRTSNITDPAYNVSMKSFQKLVSENLLYSLKPKNLKMKEDYHNMKNKSHFISFDVVNEKDELIRREKIQFEIFILEYNLTIDAF